MHISEIGFCSGHSASGVWVDEHARTTRAGPLRRRRHGERAAQLHARRLRQRRDRRRERGATIAPGSRSGRLDEDGDVAAEQERVLAPLGATDGLTPNEMEYKTRRLVNDYLQPPKVTRKMEIALGTLRRDPRRPRRIWCARDPHELMRALEVQSILDCAEMAAHASLYRTESRWGLYHLSGRLSRAQRQRNWFCHTSCTRTTRAGSCIASADRALHRCRSTRPK